MKGRLGNFLNFGGVPITLGSAGRNTHLFFRHMKRPNLSKPRHLIAFISKKK